MNGLQRWADIAATVDIAIPDEHKAPVAIIGAGAIVEVAHLPAYRSAGVEVFCTMLPTDG